MAIANITVQYVNQPKEGAKKGTIKTDTGEVYGVWADKLQNYAVGGKYTIEYDESTFQGRQYKSVKRIIQSAAGTSSPGGSGGAPNNANTKSVEMAVMGIVGKAYEGSGGLPPEDTMFAEMLAVRGAWTRAFAAPLGPTATPIENRELNDEIPF
jgi:hypothetical protein